MPREESLRIPSEYHKDRPGNYVISVAMSNLYLESGGKKPKTKKGAPEEEVKIEVYHLLVRTS